MFTGGIEDPREEDEESPPVLQSGWSWEPEGEDREGVAVRRYRVKQAMQKMADQIQKDYQAERDRMYGVHPKRPAR